MGNFWNNCAGIMPYGMTSFRGVWESISSILLMALIVFVIVFAFGRLFDNRSKSWKHMEKSAMEILKERYAKGDITKEEYAEMRKDLEK